MLAFCDIISYEKIIGETELETILKRLYKQ